MIVIIDGDNSPGTNVGKLGRLDERDKVTIYYAADNGYFTKESNRMRLIESTRCYVEFKCVPAGNCAVDLAVAMDAAVMLQNSPGEVLVLVSKDKHFKTMEKLMKTISQEWYVAQAGDIEEAVLNYKVLEVNSLDEFQNWLVQLFDKKNGDELFKKIDTMYAEKFTDLAGKSGKTRRIFALKERLF